MTGVTEIKFYVAWYMKISLKNHCKNMGLRVGEEGCILVYVHRFCYEFQCNLLKLVWLYFLGYQYQTGIQKKVLSKNSLCSF